MFTAWCVRKVSEPQDFNRQARRNWMGRGDAAIDRGVVVAGGKILSNLHMHSDLHLHTVSRNRLLFLPSAPSEEDSIHGVMDEELEADSWKSIKRKKEIRKIAIKSLYQNPVLKLFLRRYLLETACYRKRVVCNYLFTSQ